MNNQEYGQMGEGRSENVDQSSIGNMLRILYILG